jgi:hypothetical protein
MKEGDIQQTEVIDYFNEVNKILPSLMREQKINEILK